MMNKKQILTEANKVLSAELKSIKTISSSFNDEFINVINKIFTTKASYFWKNDFRD